MKLSDVVLIDDDVEFVAYAEGVLKKSERVGAIRHAYDFTTGLQLVLNATSSLFLIDLGLPDGRGVDLVSALAHRRVQDGLQARALVVTVFADEVSIMESIRSGADGYVLKDSDEHELLRSVEQALDGASPISAVAAAQLLSNIQAELRQDPNDSSGGLTPREIQLLKLFAKGLSYKEAARALELSVHTIQGYVKSIYKKLSVTSRGEAVFEAIQTGVIKLDRG